MKNKKFVKKGLTLIEVLVTIGILSMIILTLISSAIFIVKSSDMISKSNVIKSKFKYHYFNHVFRQFFVAEIQRDEGGKSYKRDTRYDIEKDRLRDPNLQATLIFRELYERMISDEDIKNWGLTVEEVSLVLDEDKPISSVIVTEGTNQYKLTVTLSYFKVYIKYRTKDNRVLTLKIDDLPLINNIDSTNIIPEGTLPSSTTTRTINTQPTESQPTSTTTIRGGGGGNTTERTNDNPHYESNTS
jgi:prepilin-type N-terminal cleavage/methylation domain-containing protein